MNYWPIVEGMRQIANTKREFIEVRQRNRGLKEKNNSIDKGRGVRKKGKKEL